MPAPFFTSEVAPPLLPIAVARVFAPTFVPVSSKVRAPPCPLKPIAPTLLKFTAPAPDASSLPPFVPTEKRRSVLTAAPVYCSVPPFSTKLVAALPDAPMPLAAEPLASVLTLTIPSLIVVLPV